ncbi:MAG: hypothetical protein KKB90_12820 [Actinobacteria bacterium]|nr:hypothetical protein [Actinomycetota bacterium]MCG2817530.1 DUF5719 family protein [Actinomycetes bacterium]MBU4219821.1 hypothetical protein [Actinomycetota bacterium]MBU4358905.1 hypothetical protein [Actinomycetota bacterium]MBU4392741.1 hypothetical protein [Actinomycetota bacterium]
MRTAIATTNRGKHPEAWAVVAAFAACLLMVLLAGTLCPAGDTGAGAGCSTWYLAEGSNNWGFSTRIAIENPNDIAVNARITYMTNDGEIPGGTVNLPPRSGVTVPTYETVWQRDFSTRVECLEGETIAVERLMYMPEDDVTRLCVVWPQVDPSGHHSSIGVTSPSATWYFPEGSSDWGFECWLLVGNPNRQEATCNITYMIEGEGPRTFEKKLKSNSRRSFNISDDIGAKDASMKVDADVPVVAERSMYVENKKRKEGHVSIGADSPSRDFFLAEGSTAWGFTTYLLVQNPNSEAARVTLTYMTDEGLRAQPAFTIPPNSRKTVRVNDVLPDVDFATYIHGSIPVVAERAMYRDSPNQEGQDHASDFACHDSIGVAEPHTTFYLPNGMGKTDMFGTNFSDTYILIQNPNPSEVTVEIFYLTHDGLGNSTSTVNVPAYSRRTYSMSDSGIEGSRAIIVTSVTTGCKIVVEKSIYWDPPASGTCTIGCFED